MILSNIINLYEEIRNEPFVVINFVKADRSKRSMTCTLNFDHIPVLHHPRSNPSESVLKDSLIKTQIITVYDTQNRKWCKVKYDSIICVTKADGKEYTTK